jgi:hypothetical protein
MAAKLRVMMGQSIGEGLSDLGKGIGGYLGNRGQADADRMETFRRVIGSMAPQGQLKPQIGTGNLDMNALLPQLSSIMNPEAGMGRLSPSIPLGGMTTRDLADLMENRPGPAYTIGEPREKAMTESQRAATEAKGEAKGEKAKETAEKAKEAARQKRIDDVRALRTQTLSQLETIRKNAPSVPSKSHIEKVAGLEGRIKSFDASLKDLGFSEMGADSAASFEEEMAAALKAAEGGVLKKEEIKKRLLSAFPDKEPEINSLLDMHESGMFKKVLSSFLPGAK